MTGFILSGMMLLYFCFVFLFTNSKRSRQWRVFEVGRVIFKRCEIES